MRCSPFAEVLSLMPSKLLDVSPALGLCMCNDDEHFHQPAFCLMPQELRTQKPCVSSYDAVYGGHKKQTMQCDCQAFAGADNASKCEYRKGNAGDDGQLPVSVDLHAKATASRACAHACNLSVTEAGLHGIWPTAKLPSRTPGNLFVS